MSTEISESATSGPLPASDFPSPTSSPEVPIAGDLQAVMVTAAVDVDGMNVTATAYVAGVIEEGGSCVYTFVSPLSDTGVTTETSSVPDRSTTVCAAAVLPVSQLARGSWSVSLTYTTSAGTSVSSEPLALEIP